MNSFSHKRRTHWPGRLAGLVVLVALEQHLLGQFFAVLQLVQVFRKDRQQFVLGRSFHFSMLKEYYR